MKNTITLILFLGLLFPTTISHAQSCLPNGITFTTQGQIDSFSIHYPGCTMIEGDVNMGGIVLNNPIINLEGLANLTSIGGNLIIRNNYNLASIDGLVNLSSIGGDLAIGDNSTLETIASLNLISVGGDLSIEYNYSLANIDGLKNLTDIEGSLSIKANEALTNIDGLINLTEIGEDLYIFGNPILADIDGLLSLTTIGKDLKITDNATLTNCCAIQNLLTTPAAIGGNIVIHHNPSECSNENEILAADCVTSIQTPTRKIDISISPNPANNLIYISAKNQQSIDKVLIYNNLGELVLAQKGAKVDVSHLPKGLYLVKVQAGEKMGVAKLVRL